MANAAGNAWGFGKLEGGRIRRIEDWRAGGLGDWGLEGWSIGALEDMIEMYGAKKKIKLS